MSENIVKIPISRDQREINKHGKGYVPCQISQRWLQFEDTADKDLHFVFVDVMTLNENNKEHKICRLCVKTEDLTRALNNATRNFKN